MTFGGLWARLVWAVFSGFLLLLALAFLGGYLAAVYAEPVAARQYRATVIRESRLYLGLSAPVALFAGQIEQESGWRPTVCSAYACGLTQFTPDTALTIGQRIGQGSVLDPEWAIRAMIYYDRTLYGTVPRAHDDCTRWDFTLSAYNGGLGNVVKDARLCTQNTPCDATLWWGNVERWSARAGPAMKENRGYVLSIASRRQFTYSSWGSTVRYPLCQP